MHGSAGGEGSGGEGDGGDGDGGGGLGDGGGVDGGLGDGEGGEQGDGGGGEQGVGGGGEGDGEGSGGEGDGGDGDGDGGGTGQAVWQTYFCAARHGKSFHMPVLSWELNDKQSSPPELLGSPYSKFQLVYDSGVLDGLHTHVPSDAASVPPIHKRLLPAAAATSSAFCAADCTVASCRPAAWQAASASAHGRASLISV